VGGTTKERTQGNGVSSHGGTGEWLRWDLGLGTWGGRDKRHLSSGSACTALGRRQSRRGDLARWTDAKAACINPFFTERSNMFKKARDMLVL
jgi:hypothetical protein